MHIPSAAIVILIGSVAALPPNIMPVLSQQLVQAYSLSDAQLGYFVAAGTLAGAIASMSAPYWIGRVRMVWVIGASLFIYAVAIHALPHAGEATFLYALQFLLGGALVVISSVCSSVLLRRPNPARTMSLKITCDVVVASAFLYLLPISRLGLDGLVIALSVCFCFGVLLAFRWPREPQQIMTRRIDVEAVGHAPMAAWWVLLTLVAFYTAGVSGWNYLGRLAANAGLDTEASASAVAGGLFLGIIGSLGAASLAGRLRTIWPQTLGGVAFAVSIAALGSVTGFGPFLFAVLVFNIAWNFFIPFLMALLAARDRSGRLSTLLPATAMMGGVLGPPFTGNLMQWTSYRTAMLFMAVLAAASIVSYVVMAGLDRRKEGITRTHATDL